MTPAETVAEVLAEVAGAPAEEVLALTARRFPGRIALASSLGPEDQVITAMIAASGLEIPIFTLDTGRLFPEAYDLIARTTAQYGVPIRAYVPDAAEVEEMVAAGGVNLFRDSIEQRKLCCDVRKVRPLRRAQAGLDAWVCGLRSGQGATRQTVAPAEWDAGADLVKINPLADWDEDHVWEYIRANDVPYNPLHDQGFPSIGCAPCTRAVAPGEDHRSGRWWWESAEHRECGLHRRTAGGAA
jgi:phosphoadenosine phosphosulfate reductase